MDNLHIINQTAAHVRSVLQGESSGHDWWHVYRVWQNAKLIGRQEQVDMFVVELAALLHDIADYKVHGGDDTLGPIRAAAWLRSLNVDETVISHVAEIIRTMSFKGANVQSTMHTKEGLVVQDADRLDALGAIGIARTFAYGGYAHHVIYDPERKPENHDTFEQYKNSDSSVIHHFYEKLLLLKDRMNTQTGARIAQERHEYMEQYLKRFFAEWDGMK